MHHPLLNAMLKSYVIYSLKTIIFYLSNIFLLNVILAGISPSLHYEQIRWLCCFWSIFNVKTRFASSWKEVDSISGSGFALTPIPLALRTIFRLLLDVIFIIIPLSLSDALLNNSSTYESSGVSATFILSCLNQIILLTIFAGIENRSTSSVGPMSTILPILLIPLNIPIIIFSIYQENLILSGLIVFGLLSLFLPLFFRRSG
jgi:ABC-type transport system involved in cytochrome c biogenesis permease component|uniref:Uncharacterized protein n=1 Tax=Diphylleia rotans TaxID=190327 RepID=A0A146I6U3_9EUKA|nr:hypothetical protein A5449_gp33 [Diphylleia rotans]BAU71449.1 hypothetical protein [Diphylleia rotans]